MQEALLAEKLKLQEAVEKELKGKAAVSQATAAVDRGGGRATSSIGTAADSPVTEDDVDALDAFMSDVKVQLEQDKVRKSGPGQLCCWSEKML